MYDHTLNRGRKHFYCYFYEPLVRKDILKCHKCHIKDCFKINGKGKIIRLYMLNSKIKKEK